MRQQQYDDDDGQAVLGFILFLRQNQNGIHIGVLYIDQSLIGKVMNVWVYSKVESRLETNRQAIKYIAMREPQIYQTQQSTSIMGNSRQRNIFYHLSTDNNMTRNATLSARQTNINKILYNMASMTKHSFLQRD